MVGRVKGIIGQLQGKIHFFNAIYDDNYFDSELQQLLPQNIVALLFILFFVIIIFRKIYVVLDFVV